MTPPAVVPSFSLLDGAIAVLSLVVTVWIGLRVKRYVGTIEDYLVASRGMGLYVGAASLLSTEVGIITYMYQAQFGFVAGFSAFVVGLITLAVCLLVGRTGFVITPVTKAEKPATKPNWAWYMYVMIATSVERSEAAPT